MVNVAHSNSKEKAKLLARNLAKRNPPKANPFGQKLLLSHPFIYLAGVWGVALKSHPVHIDDSMTVSQPLGKIWFCGLLEKVWCDNSLLLSFGIGPCFSYCSEWQHTKMLLCQQRHACKKKWHACVQMRAWMFASSQKAYRKMLGTCEVNVDGLLRGGCTILHVCFFFKLQKNYQHFKRECPSSRPGFIRLTFSISVFTFFFKKKVHQ